MALRNVRLDGDPLLRKKSKTVKEVNDRIKELAADMFETMYHENGVGLAAPQVGILKRVIVVDIGEEENDPRCFINPEIISEDGTQRGPEGCLSVPGMRGLITRPDKITVKALDENGVETITEAEGFFARAICHEIDHLEGILFIDRDDFEPEDNEEDEYADEEFDDELIYIGDKA